MVDTFRPLKLTQAALDVEDRDYAYSWQPEQHSGGDGQMQDKELAQS
jgi:homogentisate 1,2-dioxygenase